MVRGACWLIGLLWLPASTQAQTLSEALRDVVQGMVDETIETYNAKSTRKLTTPVDVLDAFDTLHPRLRAHVQLSFERGALASTLPVHVRDGELIVTDRAATYDRCAVIVHESTATLRGEDALRQTLAHEIFHCFIFQEFGPQARLELDGWIFEGMCEWAATVVAGENEETEDRWLSWLSHPAALSERAYDAFPFYLGLNRWTGRLWEEWHHLLKSDSSEAIGFLRGAYGKELSHWAPSLMRRPEWGPPWDADGPAIPAETSYPNEIVFFDGETLTYNLDALKPFAVQVLLPEDMAVRVTMRNAAGGIRDIEESSGAFEEFFESGFDRTLCAGECLCDSGQPPADFVGLKRAAVVQLATTAFPGGGKIVIEEVEPRCCGPEHRVFPELVGLWRLDTAEAIRQLWAPEPNSAITPSGSLTVSIKEDGTVSKVYDNLSFERVTEFPNAPTIETFDRTNGVVGGCLSTRAIGSMGARSFVFQAAPSVSRVYSLPNGDVFTEDQERLGLRWGVGNAGNAIGLIVFHGDGSFEIGAGRFVRVTEELD